MITDPKKFIGTLFTVVGNKHIHCNICDQLCQFSIDDQKSIENHMLTLGHVLKLQTLYVQQTTKTLGKGLLFSLQIANQKNKEQTLDNYFEECIGQMDYVNSLEYELQKSHIGSLVSFYNYLYKHQIELLDPADVVTFLKNKQEDFTVYKQLLNYHKLQFTASQTLSLSMVNRVNAKRAVDKLSPKQCEIYYNQMVDELKAHKPLFSLPYMLIRLPYMDCQKVSEVEFGQLANDNMLQITQNVSVPIPIEVQRISQYLIEKREFNVNDQLKVSSTRLSKARTQLSNQTQDYLYKLFLQNATLNFVKNMKEEVIEISQEQTQCKKVKTLQKEQYIQLDDSDQFSVQVQL